jgi:signal transduction histidine kinase
VSALWWTLLGVAVGVAVMVPVVRVLLARGERRAREAERQARDAQRLAELGAMTSGLAHEIKNPLSTVGLNAQLLGESLREADLPEAQRGRLLRRLESLGREVDRLGGILNDFLQFAGRMKLDPQPHDLVGIVDELSDFFLPQCNQARVTLRTQLPPAPVTARVDLDLFKQALLNLMINAVQAMSDRGDDDGRAGELILRVDPGDGEARIHVTDTGPGVAPDRLDSIFHPYVSSKSGGTGLGLPTARRIVEEHGGRLTVHSDQGAGSDFVIHVPVARDT